MMYLKKGWSQLDYNAELNPRDPRPNPSSHQPKPPGYITGHEIDLEVFSYLS